MQFGRPQGLRYVYYNDILLLYKFGRTGASIFIPPSRLLVRAGRAPSSLVSSKVPWYPPRDTHATTGRGQHNWTPSKHILCEISLGNTWPQLNRINKWVRHIEYFAIKSSKEFPECGPSGGCCWLLWRNNSIYVDWDTKSISFHFTISSLFLPNKMAVVKPLHNFNLESLTAVHDTRCLENILQWNHNCSPPMFFCSLFEFLHYNVARLYDVVLVRNIQCSVVIWSRSSLV